MDAQTLHWWPDMVLAAGLLVGAAAVLAVQRMGLTRQVALGGLRTMVQLAAVGYVLKYVFAADRWYWVILALLAMASIGSITATGRQGEYRRRLAGPIWLGLFFSSGLTLVLVTEVVIRVEPWYHPHYLIPLFGMIVGNSMTAATLAGERFTANLEQMRDRVEAALSLGATVGQAVRPAVRPAIRAALIPTINTLMIVGLVKLPGMMTGQILSGEPPLNAAKYQMVVMFMIMLSDSIAASIAIQWGKRGFFTPAAQLRPLAARSGDQE